MKKRLLFLAVFSATLVTAQNVPSYVPTNGLIGWWPFNGNANDESGNSNNGTVNGATLTSDRDGNLNAAYDFDGVNDFIQVSGNNIPVYGKTYSIWVKPDALQNNPRSILEHGSAGSSRWALRIKSNQIESVFGIGCSGNTTPAQTTNSMNTTGWKHLVMRDNGGDTLEIFLNDTLVSTQYVNNPGGNCSVSGLYIGVDIFSVAEYFNGILDDIGVWNRRLTDAEIHDLFMSNLCLDTIQSQPTSNTFQTVPGSAHFTTVHSDTSATFQWQQNNGTGWTNLSDFGIYSGTTTDSLVLTGVTTSLNGYGYRCIIDACTMDTTDVAYLTVVDNVGIEESSKSLTVSPNPTSGLIYVDIKANYSVYSMTGQKVAEGKTEGQIDISNLPTGSYQLILITEENTTSHTIQKI